MKKNDTAPFYIEKEGVGINEIKHFVDYMLFQRTREYHISFLNIHGQTEYLRRLEYLPLEEGEHFIDILFAKNATLELKPIELGQFYPKLIRSTNADIVVGIDGRQMHSLSHQAKIIEECYNSGLVQGNHINLHMFACDLNKMFEDNVEITTWTSKEKRYFNFTNPNCEDSDYYYLTTGF